MELNENQLWYVRSAIHRGIAAVEQQKLRACVARRSSSRPKTRRK